MSLRTRLLAAFAYVLVLVIVALEVPLALNLSRRVDAEIRSEARSQAQLLAAFIPGRLDNREELDRLVRDADRDLGGRVIVVGPLPDGRLLADSAGSGLRSTPYASRPEIADALRGDPVQGKRHSDSLDEDILFTAVPVVSNGRTAGAVRVTQSVDAVDSEVRSDVIALIGVGDAGARARARRRLAARRFAGAPAARAGADGAQGCRGGFRRTRAR